MLRAFLQEHLICAAAQIRQIGRAMVRRPGAQQPATMVPRPLDIMRELHALLQGPPSGVRAGSALGAASTLANVPAHSGSAVYGERLVDNPNGEAPAGGFGLGIDPARHGGQFSVRK